MFKIKVGRVVVATVLGLTAALAATTPAFAWDWLGNGGTNQPGCRSANTGYFCLYDAAYMNQNNSKWKFFMVEECKNQDLYSGWWDVVSSWTHHQTGNPTVPVISWTRFPDYEPLWTMSGQTEVDYVGNQFNDKADHYDNTRGC
ncbi:hypothetical protein AB0M43_37285 [Longispora sp. NPDC051575]|uniref:hypothetical protein n=1 Tax=Longispora sp. NPDC051575 TaxID=3154943 RepID=UPI00343A8E78